jgi:pyruvate dehydrogenase E1 component alpha subunit
MNIENVADRAAAYGIQGVATDGNDVLAVYKATSEAVEKARRGEGPTLIECKTYRHKGHSRVDPAKYRPKEEVQDWLRRDPIKNLKEYLAREYSLTDDELQSIEKEAATRIDEAVKFALESPYPKPEEALEDVYSQGEN